MLSMIVARSENNVIGTNNGLPWRIPSDTKKFKENTLNKIVLMGRTTFESIGYPLSQRINMVLTKNKEKIESTQDEPALRSIIFCESIVELIKKAKFFNTSSINPSQEIMIIGGSQLYKSLLDLTEKIYLTTVHVSCGGDTFFPCLNMSEWNIVEEEFIIDEKAYMFNTPTIKSLNYSYQVLERRK